MFIKEIKIEKYKKLNNFKLKFNKVNNLHFNLSVLIGENGTAKTTILQSIVNLLSKSAERNKMVDSYMMYEFDNDHLTGADYKLTLYSDPDKLPSKLIISSYTPVEKVYKQAKKSKVTLCPIIYSEMGISKLKTIIGKYILENEGETKKIYDIVNYIGYTPDQYFVEFNESILSRSTLETFSNSLQSGDYDEILEGIIADLDISLDAGVKLVEFEGNILNYIDSLDSRTLRTKRNSVYYYMDIWNAANNKGSKSKFTHEQLKHVYIEFVYILQKIKLFSRANFETINSYYKGSDQRLVHSSLLFKYFEGKLEFYKDLQFIMLFNKYVINDLWFVSQETQDLVPLSLWSSGELSLFLRLVEIATSVTNNSLLLIDEPETHLHPRWINSYIQILKDIIDVSCHVIIATHAPLIVSDIPNEGIVLLRREGPLVKQSNIEERTLGLDVEDILKKVFNVQEKEGTVLESYEKQILNALAKEDLDTAIELYDELGDSPTKFDLFLKIKKLYEAGKSRE